MSRRLTIPILFVIVGLALVGTAVFADALGLDQYAGWGRGRVTLLILGIGTTLASVFFLRFSGPVVAAAQTVRTFIESLPAVSRARGNPGMIMISRLLRDYASTLPILAAVILIYIWFVSSGTLTTWISPTRYYANLARGFLNGNLYIPTRPDANLLQMPDPYDPAARARANTDEPADITFYNGRFYLYWGPVPALVLAALSPFTQGRVGDLFLVFGFVCGIFLVEYAILVSIWDRFFRELPGWILRMSILLAGLSGPVTFMLNNARSARIYEAAITGGQFFLISGFLAALSVLNRASSNWRLAVAGTLWALAIGTRQVLVFPIGFIVFMVLYWIFRNDGWSFKSISKAMLVILPLAVGFASLGWYNWARFGSVTESGLYYQLAGLNLQEHYDELVDPLYVYQNLYNYLLNPLEIESQFPFVRVENGNTEAIFSSYALPTLYTSQTITGLLCFVPFVVFALIPSARLFQNLFRKRHAQFSANESDHRLLNWITVSLSGAFLAAFGVLMVFFWAAMRYIEDFMPSLIVLSAIGFWQGYQALPRNSSGHRAYVVFGTILAVASISISLLLAISVNDARFLLFHLAPMP